MYTDGSGENGLALIVDSRTKNCTAPRVGGVLKLWGPGRSYLGQREWDKTLRIALRDYGQAPLSAKELKARRAEVLALCAKRDIRTLLVMQTGAQRRVKTVHQAWNLFKPGNPYAWAGCVLNVDGLQVLPVLNPTNYEFAYTWLVKLWMQRGLSLARGAATVREWPKMLTTPNEEMLDALDTLSAATLVSVDIETNAGGSIITALGLSSADLAVSIPWDSYPISGTDEVEPGILDYANGEQIKRRALALLASDVSKVGQNFSFDVYALNKRGYAVGGEIEDTLLLARDVFPQFKRGLQQITSYLHIVEPWKSLHKPPHAGKNDKSFDKWTATPRETRLYNCKDCLATHWDYTAMLQMITDGVIVTRGY